MSAHVSGPLPLPRRVGPPAGKRLTALWLARAFCLTIGPLLLVDGGFGLIFAGTTLAVGDDLPHKSWNLFYEFNSWHHGWHVLTGLMLLVTGLTRRLAPLGALVFGLLYAIQAPLGFIDGNDVLNLFYSSFRENFVHTVLAVVGISLGVLGGRELRSARDPAGHRTSVG